jgi:hypothetical protein
VEDESQLNGKLADARLTGTPAFQSAPMIGAHWAEDRVQ